MEREEYVVKKSQKGYLLFYKNGKRIARDKIPKRTAERLIREQEQTTKKPQATKRVATKPTKKQSPPARPIKKVAQPVARPIKKVIPPPAPPPVARPIKKVTPPPAPPPAVRPIKKVIPPQAPPSVARPIEKVIPPQAPPPAVRPIKKVIPPPAPPPPARLFRKVTPPPAPPPPARLFRKATAPEAKPTALPVRPIIRETTEAKERAPSAAASTRERPVPSTPESSPQITRGIRYQSRTSRPRANSLGSINSVPPTPPFQMRFPQRVLATDIKSDVYASISLSIRPGPGPYAPNVFVSPYLYRVLDALQQETQKLRFTSDERADLFEDLRKKGTHYWRFGHIRYYLFFFSARGPIGSLYNAAAEVAPNQAARGEKYQFFLPLVLVPGYAPEIRIYDSLNISLYATEAIGYRLGLDPEEGQDLLTNVARHGYYHRIFGNISFYLYHISDSQTETVARLYRAK